jgi:hypothetical protein
VRRTGVLLTHARIVAIAAAAIVACSDERTTAGQPAATSSTAGEDSSAAVTSSEQSAGTPGDSSGPVGPVTVPLPETAVEDAADAGREDAVTTAARPSIDEFLHIRDSAGIRMVEHRAGYESAVREWRVTSLPDIVIGNVDGNDAYLLGSVVAATIRSDGVVVIADASANQLRFFNSNGTFLDSFGRSGRGPGEFSAIAGLVRTAGDTLVVWDEVAARISWIGPDRRIARIENRPPPRVFHVGAILGDGSRIIPVFPVQPRAPGDGVLWRPEGRIAFVHHPSGATDTLASFRGHEQAGGHPAGTPAPRDTRFATRGTSRYFAFGDNERFDIALWRVGSDRSLRQVVRLTRAYGPAELTPAYVRAWQARMRLLYRDHPLLPQVERGLASPVMHATLPAFDNFLIDDRDNLWVEEFRSNPDAPRHVTIFRTDGIPIARAVYPDELAVLEIGPDYVLGFATNELDVVSVRRHRLTR